MSERLLGQWPNMKVRTEADVEKLYDATRSFLMHEDDLINQRLAWMLTLNGFLFAALGLSISAEAFVNENDELQDSIENIRVVLAASGFLSAIVASVGVIAANKAIRAASYHYNYVMYRHGVRPYYPRILGRRKSNILGMICALSTPFVVAGPWMFLIFRSVFFREDFCGINSDEASFWTSLLICVSAIIFSSTITIFPELPDPFKKGDFDDRVEVIEKYFAATWCFIAISWSITNLGRIPNQVIPECSSVLRAGILLFVVNLPFLSLIYFSIRLRQSPFRASELFKRWSIESGNMH